MIHTINEKGIVHYNFNEAREIITTGFNANALCHLVKIKQILFSGFNKGLEVSFDDNNGNIIFKDDSDSVMLYGVFNFRPNSGLSSFPLSCNVEIYLKCEGIETNIDKLTKETVFDCFIFNSLYKCVVNSLKDEINSGIVKNEYLSLLMPCHE